MAAHGAGHSAFGLVVQWAPTDAMTAAAKAVAKAVEWAVWSEFWRVGSTAETTDATKAGQLGKALA